MLTHKNIDIFCILSTIVAIVISIFFINGKSTVNEKTDYTMEYENILFDDTKIHSINIVIDDWNKFLDTCTNEDYTVCSVMIDGELYKNIGIRAKGNTSIKSVEDIGNGRYSFKLEFDKYTDGYTYHGLDKIVLNNLIEDSTMMKDYLAYKLMSEFDVAAPLCSYVYITVNGEDWGLYLAVEAIEESFLQRNFGTDYGELYRPESNDTDKYEVKTTFNTREPVGMKPLSNRDFGRNSPDIKLQYTDDSINSYNTIFSNAKTNITRADKYRLIKSLKSLSTDKNMDNTVDIEQVIRYFVVHNYVVNGDSYTGSIVHNYYLYEKDGKLSMIPWDYNLAFGTFRMGHRSSVVNDPINTPQSVTDKYNDRPMIDWIFKDDKYTELYHKYFKEFIGSTDISGMIDTTYELIAPYIKRDPTKFYTYNEFKLGVSTLREFCKLRTLSIQGQLSGEISATSEGQKQDKSGLINDSELNVADMGTMSTQVFVTDEKGNIIEGPTNIKDKIERNKEVAERNNRDKFNRDNIAKHDYNFEVIFISTLIMVAGIVLVKQYKK